MKNGKNLKLGDAHATPKKYPRSTSVKAWGCPRGTPFFIGKNQVTFQNTIFFIASCTMHFSWSVSCFCFQLSFVLFTAING
jgi:hypothetical protein